MHDGRIVGEWYGNGDRPERPAAVFSMTKTIVSLLLARAVAAGHVELDLPITSAIPELRQRDPRFDRITLADLVDMRSGIAFSEDTSFPWLNRDYPSVYYATDLAALVVGRPVIEAPPGRFMYNDYAPNLVGLALERLTGESLDQGPFRQLWHDLGARRPATWARDDRGFPHCESGVAATARDLARIGQAMLGDGRVAGRPVAPPAFLERSLGGPDDLVTSFLDVPVGYANGWWRLPRPAGGADLVAMGAHGQVMLVSPATRTVVVRLGDDHPGLSNIDIALRLQRLADSGCFGDETGLPERGR
ncbi:serine hydrolase [Actinoplanes sp. M2I2]|uniref:serine hydrolase domain-containing protein n=1 Tax=Actinoplanes sp. M2I2 TaxID=1734444 RepID=UPI0020215E81|nr:serine hydrolase [Actinoplanes sp. M2I2]